MLLVWPPLVAAGPPMAERARRSVPMTEVWELYQPLAEDLAELPDGAQFEVRVTEGRTRQAGTGSMVSLARRERPLSRALAAPAVGTLATKGDLRGVAAG